MEFEIKPESKLNLKVKELWDYRELFYFFTWRDVKVKYKQTVFGFLWTIFQPLFMTLIFTFFLGSSISEKTHLSIPYPLFALSGMLLWGIFSGGMSNAANSMVNNANIIKKIYFPRLIIPVSSIFVALIDFFVAFVIFLCFLFYYGTAINYKAFLYLPLSVFITCISAAGLGCFLAALNVKYRDVRYAIPFLVQALMFFTPVMYPAEISNNVIIEGLLKFNPIAGALELIRAIFADYVINVQTLYCSALSSLLIFIFGVLYFKKTERYFADLA